MSLFSLIGGAVSGILGLGGGTSQSSQANFAQQLEAQKKEFDRQMNLQAQESKKTLTLVAVGGAVLVMIMFLFMKK